MQIALQSHDIFEGTTALLIDISGSMQDTVSGRSEMRRMDAAAALGIVLTEMCEKFTVTVFGTTYKRIAPRRGLALIDAVQKMYHAGGIGHGTNIGAAVNSVKNEDRIIVISDGQSHDAVPNPGFRGYMINVAAYKNGVGYGAWTNIDGFSEATVRYMLEIERADG